MVGALTAQYDKETVAMAAITTMAMFISLTLYAAFTKTDMTKMGGLLSSSCMMLFIFIIMYSLFFRSKVLNMIICCVVVALLSVFIVYDTQIVIGGAGKYGQLDLDDYCIGALIIYSDIVTIFIYLLQIFGGGN